jgi:DNA-directed RNA polymerase specialized sigma24 family protein
LKPDERGALLLLGLGYSYREIAAMQGWTMTKVHRFISEGRASVRRLMERGQA